MTKRTRMILLTGVLCLACVLSLPAAAQTGASPAPRTDQVVHAELANIVANLLALTRFLPANPSFQETVAVLLQNRIAPPGGWVADAVVTKGDLAVVLVKCLRAMGETVDFELDDTQAAMNYLRQEGIPIDTIGEGTKAIGPLANPVARQVFRPDTDPLLKRQRFAEPDEQEYGADAENTPARPTVAPTRPQVIAIIQAITRPEEPTTRVTPFQP